MADDGSQPPAAPAPAAAAGGGQTEEEKKAEAEMIRKYGRLPNKDALLRREYNRENKHFDSGEYFGGVKDPMRKPTAIPPHLRK